MKITYSLATDTSFDTDFEKLSPSERKELIGGVIEKMHDMVVLFAEALIDHGMHDEECMDDEDCTCGFATKLQTAMNIVEMNNVLNGKTTVN